MRRIGVAVEEFHEVLGPLHERFVDAAAHYDTAHRHRTRGDTLCKGDHVRDHAVALRGEGMAEAAEAGDDLVEHQQDAVFVADRAQSLQIAFRRRKHGGRTGHRLDEYRGDGVVAVQRHQTLEFVRKMRAPFRLALRERLLLAVIGVRQVVNAAEHHAEGLAVVADAADRHAAEADAVIAALAPDEALTLALPARHPIGERDLHRGIDRFRTGIAEEHMVEIARRHRRDPAGEFERFRIGVLERRREIHFRRLRLDRRDDRLAVVAGVGAPEAGGAVDHRFSLRRVVMHVLGPRHHARALLERAVGGKGHPERLEVVRDGGGNRLARGLGAHWSSEIEASYRRTMRASFCEAQVAVLHDGRARPAPHAIRPSPPLRRGRTEEGFAARWRGCYHPRDCRL